MTNNLTSAPRVTLDTNVCDILHRPERRPEIMAEADARELRKCISDAKIVAFVSEATVFIECLSFEDKLTYLAAAFTKNARPEPDPRRVAVFEDMASLGVKMLHAPLIGAEKFIHNMQWADDVNYSAHDRNERFGVFCRLYPRHEPIMAHGQKLLAAQQSVPRNGNGFPAQRTPEWRGIIKKAWEHADDAGKKAIRRTVGPLIGEWGDVLIVASHHAYGNDIFCTADEGKRAGAKSVLHHGKRANLKAQVIHVLGPNELLAWIRSRQAA